MMRPGSSVHTVESVSMIEKQSKIRWRVFECWRSSPLTSVRSSSVCGSPTSSGVTIHGPVGPCVSHDLPSVIVADFALPVPHAHVVDDHVTADNLVGAIARHVAAAPPDNQAEFALVIQCL